eukprot:365119-Chlamydomonas_euryale.AAC.5
MHHVSLTWIYPSRFVDETTAAEATLCNRVINTIIQTQGVSTARHKQRHGAPRAAVAMPHRTQSGANTPRCAPHLCPQTCARSCPVTRPSWPARHCTTKPRSTAHVAYHHSRS